MLEGVKLVLPNEIEKKSFEIISEILGEKNLNEAEQAIVKRVIHTTADFEYADILNISSDAIESFKRAINEGGNIVTDTNMVAAGINKKVLNSFGGEVICFMADEDVAKEAKEKNITRASVCMQKAARESLNKVYVIGNAPTALIRICEMIEKKEVFPALIIGVPVGFVNVIESKELLKRAGVPFIISEGRKGGSTVGVAIVNALLYSMRKKDEINAE